MLIGLLLLTGFVLFNGVKIYQYSYNYSDQKSDVGIVLGAGTSYDSVSPIFRERLNHAIYLYQEKKIEKIILTGGYGKKQKRSDSEIARDYLLQNGIPKSIIHLEKRSKYTIENLIESKSIMDSLNYRTALIISDPLHMKRSIDLAKKIEIECQPSPTKTSMYRSFESRTKSLIYETFYYSLGKLVGKN